MADEERTVVTLQHPISHGSETITELRFRRGRLGDLKGISVGAEIPVDTLIRIGAKLCGQPTTVIEQLDEDDAGKVIEAATRFFERALAGGTPPAS